MKKRVIIISCIVIVLIVGILSYIMFYSKQYTLKVGKTSNISLFLKGDKEKDIRLNLVDSNADILLSGFNNIDYVIYLLKNKTGDVVNRGVIYNSDERTITDLEAGDYTMTLVYMGSNKFNLKGKISLIKAQDEEYSTLSDGWDIKKRIEKLTGKDSDHKGAVKIRSIKIADSMDTTYEKEDYIVSTENSKEPIYMWVSGDTLYFYCKNKMEFNESSGSMFSYLDSLIDADDLKLIKADKVKSMNYMFSGDESLSDIRFISYFNMPQLETASHLCSHCNSLSDITPLISINSDYLEDISSMIWGTSVSDIRIFKYLNTERLETIGGLFGLTKVSDLTPIANWNTSNVKLMFSVFVGTKITNVDALKNWDTSRVKSMTALFDGCVHLKDISGLKNWNTKSLTSIDSIFGYTDLKNLDALSNWKVDKIEEIKEAFSHNRNLKDISGLSSWKIKRVTNLKEIFSHTSITSLEALSNWDTSTVEDMREAFSHTKIKNLKGIEKWDISSCDDFESMFDTCLKLEDVSSIEGWNIASDKNTKDMFYKTKIAPKWYKE